jgi:mannan endo-1,4-beta-mannosidase
VAFLAPLQEMDGYWTSYGLDPTNFKRAYKHIQDIFAAEGVPEDSVYWVFAATGYESNKYPPFEDYYPGDAYVDVVGFSSYNFGYCPISSNNDPTWRTPKQLMNKHITRMNDMAPSKPVFIAQLGSSSYISQGVMDDEVKSQWLTDAYNYLADQSSVRGVIYFNFDKENECDWAFYKTWDDNQRKLEGYREGIANPAYGYVWPFEIRYNIFFNTTP